MLLTNIMLSSGTANAPAPSQVPAYVITYMRTGEIPVEVFRTVAVGRGSGGPQRSEGEAWADLSARARAAWSRENPA
jgi:hypothetical protein